MPRKHKMSSHCLSTPWNIATSTSPKSFFKDVQKADNVSTGPFAYLNHHLSDFGQVAFSMPRKHKMSSHGLRHLETPLNRLHVSRFLRRPECRLWVLRSIPLFKTSLKQHRPSRFFGDPGLRKFMAFRHLETTLNRLLQNRFLRRPEGRLWILRPIRLHNTSLKRFSPSSFFRCPGTTKWVRMAFRHFETSLHRLQQSRFLRRPEA
jgi:hypothetical protein